MAGNATCLVCLNDGGHMKIAGPCNHTFCTMCLGNHLGKQAEGGDIYPCPTCRRGCPLPAAGVDGLTDAGTEPGAAGMQQEPGERKTHKPMTGDERCRICKYKGKDTKAINRCPRCNGLDLCEGCSDAHKISPATRSHLLIRIMPPLESLSKSCSTHQEPFIKYCRSCGEPVCSLCIVLEHDSHEVWEADELIEATTKRVQSVKRKVEKRIKELQILQSEMKAARDTYCSLRDTTIVDIETKANECIEKIQLQKEQLIAAVRAVCNVGETEANLARLPGAIEGMTSALKATEQVEKQFQQSDKVTLNDSLLMKPIQRPSFVEALETVDAQLEAALCADDIDRDVHRELPHHPLPTFNPVPGQDLDIGKLSQPPFKDWTVVQNWKTTDSSIKNVAIFGTNSYALALAPDLNAKANRIRFGQVQSLKQPNTILQASYDIAATPSGSLAVLCDGKTKGNIAVKLYDKDGNLLQSIGEVGLQGPLSMSVTMYGEYVVLSRPDDKECRITAIRVDKDSKVAASYLIHRPISNILEPTDVSCGGRYTFLCGRSAYTSWRSNKGVVSHTPVIEVYEVGKGNITRIDSKDFTEYPEGSFSGSIPITATLTDDLYCCEMDWVIGRHGYIQKLVKMSNKGSFDQEVSFNTGIYGNSRMDIRGNLALVARDTGHGFFRLIDE